MKIFIVFILLIVSAPLFKVSEYLADDALIFQKICLEKLTKETKYFDVHAALVCGKDLPPTEEKILLTQSSLYHLFVVSGAHLVFVLAVLEKIKMQSLGFISLFLFTLFTGFQPPCVRALASQVFTKGNRKFCWGWNPILNNMCAGFFCLIIQPKLFNSKSLLLSWLASLGIILSQQFTDQKKFAELKTSFLIYLLLIPLLWGWGSLHPMGVILNFVVAPAFSLLLLPVDFLALFVPKIINLSDFMLDGLFWILSQCMQFLPQNQMQGNALPLNWLWVYLVFVAIFSYFLWQKKRREQWQFKI